MTSIVVILALLGVVVIFSARSLSRDARKKRELFGAVLMAAGLVVAIVDAAAG